jgi:Protein of unknown function (DUF1153)
VSGDGRWTPARKPGVVLAVRARPRRRRGLLREHAISEEEFREWERKFDRWGRPGLRVTKRERRPRALKGGGKR